LLLAPAAASAHALFGDQDPNRPLVDYLSLGFLHMVGGWDHLLFITGVVLLAGNVRSAAKLITLFVAGHSLTLLIATLAGWRLNATAVDVVIALSLVYVGVQGWRGRPTELRLTGAIVFGFGLVHGLGLSTRLQALRLPEAASSSASCCSTSAWSSVSSWLWASSSARHARGARTARIAQRSASGLRPAPGNGSRRGGGHLFSVQGAAGRTGRGQERRSDRLLGADLPTAGVP